MIQLFKIGARDQVLYWSITSDGNRLIINYGQLDGSMQTKVETVEVNQSGRDLKSQVQLQLTSRVNKQVDKGYCATIDEAVANKGNNALNLKRPMLAKKYKDAKNVGDNSWLQYKYNGYRCLITNTGEELIAYSRNGKVITTIEHITSNLVIPEGHTVDGELYCHDTSLQTIGSWIKRGQADTAKLEYVMYDTMLDLPYIDRFAAMYDYKIGNAIRLAPIMPYNPTDIVESLVGAINAGYEGLMVRQNDYRYEPGVRSNSLLKLKQHMDEEFIVIDIHESKDGWAILECYIEHNGLTFRVSAPGDMTNKVNILTNKMQYIGKRITVEFFYWTDGGRPFHPVATDWR